ncbi:MAG TPA: hypothetical protein EYP98_07780 [Planctomycetes bacterium]|nr:hypothetical protein [Planctomycetota bacterium]
MARVAVGSVNTRRPRLHVFSICEKERACHVRSPIFVYDTAFMRKTVESGMNTLEKPSISSTVSGIERCRRRQEEASVHVKLVVHKNIPRLCVAPS